ncbi:turripeptide Gsp9.3-like [Episyrphus balteatus]|uniref:turripeptide Gsp9.3-like n=1 Tax=Episyrphus balteatus TaxID=286459 RepID=UPI002486C953|nr:turripeptide Gsp9.3-like [Episyrphus balteatus]XP_055840893.1 turripeptide Gsp9.3-like [Episyrphus balteatus]
MKTVYVSLLIAVLVAVAISAEVKESDCPTFCTFDYRPVCGYDGNCYNKYGNECTLKVDRCTNAKKKDLKTVGMERCEEALAKTNPNVVTCPKE